MIEAAPTDAHEALLALIDVAAPAPVPAEQAIPLLRRLQGEDVVDLARLAYRALTGVEPAAAGEPTQRPTEVVAGFPLFVSEVLMRAIEGPDERRPTAQALLAVLETVPAAQWPAYPAADGPTGERGDEAVDQPAVDEVAVEEAVEVVADEVPDEEAPADEPVAGEVVADKPVADQPVADQPVAGESEVERTRLYRDFHQMVAPGHAVPRFEPLEGAGELPGFSSEHGRRRVRRRSSSGSSNEERRQALIWVAVIAVLILIALYVSR